MFRKIKPIKGLLSYILVATLIISFAQPVFATNSRAPVNQLEFTKDGKACSLKVMQEGGTWYVEANSLAEASESRLSINNENGNLVLFRGENITVLYTANKNTCIKNNEEYYLPLQEATISVGLRFYEDRDNLYAECLRVPQELLTDLKAIFCNNKFSTTSMILDLGTTYTVMEGLSRIYAVLPFVGNSNIIAEATGAGERDRYEEAFATILANEGSLSNLISETKTFQSEIKNSNKILDCSEEILSRDGSLAEFLNARGVDKELLDLFITEFSKYDNEGTVIEWFSAATSASEAMNMGEFLNLMTFYASAIDTEESIAKAMVSVFQDSENRFARDAANNVFSIRYGSGMAAMGSIYGEWIGDKILDLIYKKGEKQLIDIDGIAKLKTLAVTKAIDYCTGASDKSNAILYTTIYSSIQQELAAYFYNHLDDSGKETALVLRGVGIMYLKAALAAYENYDFDDDLSDAISNATTMIIDELDVLLDYAEEEYFPNYDNACVVQRAHNMLESQEAYKLWEEFLLSGEYKKYVSDDRNYDELEYVIFDINADKTPEMLIQSIEDVGVGFRNTWLFVLQGESIKLIHEQYGYGEYRYSMSQNAIIGSPEFKPFVGTSYSPFYRFNKTSFGLEFMVEQSEGVWYYSDDKNTTEISEEERAAYFTDIVWFEWSSIESLSSSLNDLALHQPLSLMTYIGKDISAVVDNLGNDYIDEYMFGGHCYTYDDIGAVFFFEDMYRNGTTVHTILCVSDRDYGYGFSAQMTYPEVCELVSQYTGEDAGQYEEQYDLMDERILYTLSFDIDGVNYSFSWEENPQNSKSYEMIISMS